MLGFLAVVVAVLFTVFSAFAGGVVGGLCAWFSKGVDEAVEGAMIGYPFGAIPGLMAGSVAGFQVMVGTSEDRFSCDVHPWLWYYLLATIAISGAGMLILVVKRAWDVAHNNF